MYDRARRPLRVVHLNREESESFGSSLSLPLSVKTEMHSTPLPRLNRQTRLQSTRIDDALQTENSMKSASSTEDIRYHFPIRSERSTPQKENDSQLGKRSRNGSANIDDRIKHSKLSLDHLTPNNQMPQLTMGAYVKAHPRYGRRQSGPITMREKFHECGHLAPICPVPMPNGFPSNFPMICNSVPFPWEPETCPVPRTPLTPQRSTQTQTSPVKLEFNNCSAQAVDKKNSTPKRLSFGSSNVLVGIRKTFGNLRRAISAERLNRSAQTLNQRSPPTPNSRLRKITDQPKMEIKPELLNRSRISRSTAIHQNPTAPISIPQPVEQKPNQPELAEEENLKCHVVKHYSDGSLKVSLRRSSTRQQFGFFISKDAEGIYISRLGGVRSAITFWNAFRVGDRITEVQGYPCNSLDVEEVRNLIRDCELVEFRIQPARSISLRPK